MSVVADGFWFMSERCDDVALDGVSVESSAAPGPVLEPDAGFFDPPAFGRPTLDGSAEDDYVAALLDTMVERRSSVDRADADLLALVVEFADASPAEADDALLAGRIERRPAEAPAADEFRVVELGARLGVSYRSAANLETEAVQLRDRLPYDGRWARNVGTDGGQTLEWAGRVALVGAVTTAWDAAHAVIASMGDRFVLLRMDSSTGRQAAGRQAIGDTGHEVQMREELAAAVAGVIAEMDTVPIDVTTAETDVLLAAADLVTLARTGVQYDYRGDVVDAHAPEMPTRFAKHLAQLVRGGVAIGIDRTEALGLAIRCARDSMPPLRLAIIDDLAEHPDSLTAEVRKRLGKPRATIDRQLHRRSRNMGEPSFEAPSLVVT